MFLKKSFLLIMTATMVSSEMISAAVEIKSDNVLNLDNGIHLFHTRKNSFFIVENGRCIKINDEHIDKELRNISSEKLDFILGNKFIIDFNNEKMEFTRIPFDVEHDLADSCWEKVKVDPEALKYITAQIPSKGFIKIIRYEDGNYGLRLHVRFNGGGFFGCALGHVGGRVVASIFNRVIDDATFYIARKCVSNTKEGMETMINIANKLESINKFVSGALETYGGLVCGTYIPF